MGIRSWPATPVAKGRVRMLLGELLSVHLRFPFDPLEIEHKDRVKDGDQEQCDESGYGKSTDLGITKRLPERATFECERKQCQDRRAHGDHYGSNALNPGIRKSALKRLSFFVHLFNEVEEHDYMADDDA